MDKQLIELNEQLSKTYIPYGEISYQASKLQAKASFQSKVKSVSMEAQADRAINKSLNKYSYSSDDIVQAYENKTLDLQKLKPEHLPEAMQKMTDAKRQAYLEEISAQRQALKEQIAQLARGGGVTNTSQKNVKSKVLKAMVLIMLCPRH